MQNEIMVTICCLVYNHEKYLRECLNGFVKQITNFKYEVVIHDDASTDSSKSIIREYQRNYPNIFITIFQERNQFSLGENIFWKYIIPNAKGKYIALCEGDDYWTDPTKLQKQFYAMEKNDICSICLHKVMEIEENGKKNNISHPTFRIKNGIIKKKEFMNMITGIEYCFQTSSYFLRRSILPDFSSASFPQFIKASSTGDTAILLLSCFHGDIFYIDEPMSCYRIGSISSKKRTEKIRSSEKEIFRHYHHQMDMMLEFDKYSDFLFHEYCMRKIDAYVFAHYLRTNNYKKLFSKRLRVFLKYFSFKARIKLLLQAYFPALFQEQWV